MISTRFTSTLAAAATLLSVASAASSSIDPIPTPTVTLPANAMQDIGCFKTPTPLVNHGPWKFQSQGNCQLICIMLDKPVLGLANGEECWCGDELPPKDSQIGNSSCNIGCSGGRDHQCGGTDTYWISLTGTTRKNIPYLSLSSSSSSSSTSTSTSTSTFSSETTVASATESSDSDKKSGGPNKTGIAVGVVVGVLALAAIVGGVIFYLRQKRRRDVEEEYRRQAAVNSFVGGGQSHSSNVSMTDSRLDPDFMNRRQSNGSIADNEDFSRRILKVTNA